ncbi:hypothetical protein PVAND_016009 [Polypedilum vanderplanki]|uniref:Uncharacterized protein n=1 Tax=Polypedilum vanderplanki TaxID=319348 RepID=A0A9J6BE78_POLVA|nr:hypothetical protein PVAND_016009 [Polypedilum vanderplanki]
MIHLLLSLLVIVGDDPPKCHNCFDFPLNSAEQIKLSLEEWIDQDCICKDSAFVRHDIKVEDITVYCCDKRRLQRWKGWKRIGHAIEKAVKSILEHTQINVNGTF